MSADDEVTPAGQRDAELTQSAGSASPEPVRHGEVAGSAPPVRDPERYEVICEHGRGGLGRVSRAHDKELGRDVAIKELLSRGPISEQRFVREARITARLEHPGIVPVHEAGRWPDGTPFYAMKLVSGRPLRALIAERNTVDERIGLLHHVIAVADAMAYAHGRNIIHRDLKPANVIVGEFGETVVIDWGLAKDLSDTARLGGDGCPVNGSPDLTTAGSVLGTPAYMPPEQERGEAVDQRADVFAIGAMLWELCSLHKVPPVDRRQRHRLLRRAGIDDDLIVILDKAIDPDPGKRYADAGALAADLKAFKSGARITAREYSLAALLAHWTRRHRAWAIAATAATALMIAGVAALAVLYRASDRNAAIAHGRLIQSYGEQGRRALLEDHQEEALIYLNEAIRGGDRSAGTRFMLARAAEPFLAERYVASTTQERTSTAIYSPDGRQLAVAEAHRMDVLDTRTRQRRFSLSHGGTVFGAAYSADGRMLVTGDLESSVRVWDASTGALIRAFDHATIHDEIASYLVVALSPDNRTVVADAHQGARAWDLATGRLLAEIAHENTEYNEVMGLSRDGRWLAVASRDEVFVYDSRSWARVLTIGAPRVSALDFDPRGSRLAISTFSGEASVWSIPDGARVQRLLEASEPLTAIKYAPDGTRVATAGREGSGWIWSTETGRVVATLSAQHASVTSLEFDVSSRLLASASTDGTLRISEVETGLPLSTLRGPHGNLRASHLSPDAQDAIAVGGDEAVHVLDADARPRRWATPEISPDCGKQGLAVPDAGLVVLSCHDRGTEIWDVARHALVAELPGVAPMTGGFAAAPPVLSSDLTRIAIAIGNRVVVYRLPEGVPDHEVMHAAAVTAAAFADTGHTLVTGDEHGGVRLDAGHGEVASLVASDVAIDAAALRHDGGILVADTARHLRAYDATGGSLIREVLLDDQVRALRLSADDRRMVTVSRYGSRVPAVLWDLERGRRIAALGVPQTKTFEVRFVRGEQQVLTAGSDGVARLWDATTGARIRSFAGSNATIIDATLSPDGALVVTGAIDGDVRFWDAATGALVWKLRAHRTMVAALHFEGDDLVTRSSTGALSQWRLPAVGLDAVEPILRCLPLRFDPETGGTIEQPRCDRDTGAGSAAP